MKPLVNTFLLLLLPAFAFSQNANAIQFDSLKYLLNTVQSDTERVWLYDKILAVAPKQNEAVEYGMKGFELAKHIHFDKGAILCGNHLGFYLVELDYYKAAQILLETKQLCIKNNNEFMLAMTLGSLGYAYGKFDFENSILNFRAAKKIIDKLNLPQSIVPINMAMGMCFKDYGMNDSALIYLQKGYDFALKTPFPVSPLNFYRPLGEVYYKKNLLDTAMKFFNKSIAESKNKADGVTVGEAYFGIAMILRDRNQIDSAKFYAKKSLAIQQAAGRTVYIIKSANLLYELNKISHPEEAVKYRMIELSLKDSLFNQEKSKQIEKLAYDQREQEARTQRRLEAHQIEFQNKIKIYSLLGILSGLGILTLVFYRNNKQKQKANELLQKQKEEIDEKSLQLEKSLATLKATQNQLIQSEKLASLGELTAGIAHEIQNPMNFVNNFSKFNIGIADELDAEINKPNIDKEYIAELLTDLKSNQEKINFHGNRASSIVSGMLEHSRTNAGVKESTDINKLCDEYLRLSFHALRNKDKNFNCDMVTHFDETIPNIEIVGQDVGRVILNLINNAFYAVNERSNLVGSENLRGYKPIVTVTTKKTNNTIEIRVKDNGTGMSDAVKEKIFQPFFTTKPTGSGTGLGLSLAYDIITKGHGGTLTVESEEGVGSEFVISLPIL